MTAGPTAVPGGDGRLRCGWAVSSADYERYHDEEWGRPVRGEPALFERLSLEAFQSGLSWITILRKRDAFREAFRGFVPRTVAAFGSDDVERLMTDARLVRNRRKIEATIANARALLALPAGSTLGSLLEEHRAPGAPVPFSLEDVPAITPGSTALARTLKGAGFRFVGPTTAYAMLQACGYVNDHLRDCWVRPEVERELEGGHAGPPVAASGADPHSTP